MTYKYVSKTMLKIKDFTSDVTQLNIIVVRY